MVRGKQMEEWVGCSHCGMWVDFKSSGIVDRDFEGAGKQDYDYVCNKCNRLLELEARLEVCQCAWTAVKGDSKSSKGPSVLVTEVVTENSFSVLPVEVLETEDKGREVTGPKKGEGVGCTDSTSGNLWDKEKTKGKCMLLGDSIVRYVDREFSRVDKAKRTRVCLPGARVEDVSDRVSRLVGDEEIVVVEIGTNNLRRDSQDMLRSRFKELMCRLKSTRSKVAFCGILPRFDGRVAGRKIASLNRWMEIECRDEGFYYVDVSCFWERRDLFARDGLHLNGVGASMLGKLVNSCVESLSLN